MNYKESDNIKDFLYEKAIDNLNDADKWDLLKEALRDLKHARATAEYYRNLHCSQQPKLIKSQPLPWEVIQ